MIVFQSVQCRLCNVLYISGKLAIYECLNLNTKLQKIKTNILKVCRIQPVCTTIQYIYIICHIIYVHTCRMMTQTLGKTATFGFIQFKT